MTFRKTITTAEVLKGISVFVQELPTGRIYQYIDVFVGDKGAGLPTHLKNGLVGFKVEKAWIKDNNVNESLVTLQWYNNSWEPLYTEKVGGDNNYVYFESKTPGFSFFVITELISASSKASASNVQSASPTINETQLTNRRLATNPAIYGDRMVWEDNRSGNEDIYMYDILTSKETPVTTSGSAYSPAIYGDRIVWEDWRNENGDIYMYDLSTKTETQITTNESDQEFPAIYGDRIMWQDNRSGNWDIYMYDIATSEETQIIINEYDQEFPAIYGDRIVWQDNRSGNWDIYMCRLI
jgi:PGF-pre-PGF domain-containing protein